MTWLRIDDSMTDHPKIIGLSDGAFRLHVSGLCYAARYLTDGFVNATYPKQISKERFIPVLVDAGLWAKVTGGWQINDYLEYNPSKEKVEEQRTMRKARAQAGADARWHAQSNAQSNASSNDSVDAPVPSPTPLDVSRDRSSRAEGTAPIDQPEEPRPELPKALKRILDARILDDLTSDQCALVARAWFHGVQLRHSLASVESADNPAAMLVSISRRITNQEEPAA